VRAKKNREIALGPQALEKLPDDAAALRIEAGRRLVENEDVGTVDEAPRDLEGHVDAEPAIGFPPMARRPPRPLLARDFVRYVGEPVAAVVSVDRYVGADAAGPKSNELYQLAKKLKDPNGSVIAVGGGST